MIVRCPNSECGRVFDPEVTLSVIATEDLQPSDMVESLWIKLTRGEIRDRWEITFVYSLKHEFDPNVLSRRQEDKLREVYDRHFKDRPRCTNCNRRALSTCFVHSELDC